MGKPTSPQKRAGFAQGVYAISVAKKERIGILRTTMDGRKYRYARAGGTALVAGKMSHAAQAAAHHVDEAILATVAVGTTQLALTVTVGTAIAAGALEGGYFQINSGTGAGHQYAIAGNTAITNAETALYLSLDEPIRVALDTTSTFNLCHSLWYATDESSTGENMPTGVAPVPVTENYYYWSQTGGPAICLSYDTPAVGTILVLSTSLEGAVEAVNTSINIDQPIVGVATHLTGVASDYTAMFLNID